MNMGRQTISAVLVIHNEERLIRRCLESIKGVVDEIIVIHDGPCEDSSLEICEEYTDKIFVRPYMGNCDPHRIFGFERSTGSWILILDADEYLSQELRENIRFLVHNSEVDLYAFVWPYPINGQPATERIKHPYRACLARRSKLYFYGLIHEPLRTYGRAKKLPLVVYHMPEYEPFSWSNFRRKVARWARNTALWVWKDSSEIPTYGLRDQEMLVKYLQRRRSKPLLMMFVLFARQLLWHLYKGMWKLGIKGLKVAFLDALNVAMQQYYIWKLRPRKGAS